MGGGAHTRGPGSGARFARITGAMIAGRPPLLRLTLLLSLLACAVPKPPAVETPFEDDSAVLVPTGQLSMPPFTVLQRVRGRMGAQEIDFECTVQLSQNKLTVTGTTRDGTRAFEVEQVGSEVRWQAFELDEVALEPLQVLYDVHRAFFRGLPAPQTKGAHELVQGDQVVREYWQRRHVVERRFHSLDTSSSLFVILFEGAPAPVIAPRMHVTNLHYSYWLEIQTIKQEQLGGDYALAVERNGDR